MHRYPTPPYSSSRVEQHIAAVLNTIRKGGLRLSPEKCEFGRPNAPFLGFHVSGDGITMNDVKIKSINPPAPEMQGPS